jgi:hypothetical protein
MTSAWGKWNGSVFDEVKSIRQLETGACNRAITTERDANETQHGCILGCLYRLLWSAIGWVEILP